jgi:hypothetical protein
METPPGIRLFYPNWGSEELSAKLAAMILNAWNPEKPLPFLKILCYYLDLKKEFSEHRLYSASPGLAHHLD